jgi:hypothetical protein
MPSNHGGRDEDGLTDHGKWEDRRGVVLDCRPGRNFPPIYKGKTGCAGIYYPLYFTLKVYNIYRIRL